MKKLLEIGNRYIRESDWKVIAVLKFCLLSLGMIIGMGMPKKAKKPAYIACGAVFLLSYVPLMIKLIRMLIAGEDTDGSVSLSEE